MENQHTELSILPEVQRRLDTSVLDTSVYLFERGHRGILSLLGGKRAGLAEMTRAVCRVPPGFTITTAARAARNDRGERYTLHRLEQNFYLLIARFGFMEFPNVPKLLEECRPLGLKYKMSETSFFLSLVIPTEEPGMVLWREQLFAAMLRNAAHATDFFRIPSNRVMEVDLRLEIGE
jgi:K+ transporter